MILKFTFQLSWFSQSDNLLPLVELTAGEFSGHRYSSASQPFLWRPKC